MAFILSFFFGWIASSLIFVVAPRNDLAFLFCHCERSYASHGNPLICTFKRIMSTLTKQCSVIPSPYRRGLGWGVIPQGHHLFTYWLLAYTIKQQALPFDLLNDFPHIFHKLARILCLLHLLKTYIPCIYALDLWYILLTITLLQHYITKVNCFFLFFYKSL